MTAVDAARFERGRPDLDERARIAAGVGAELRQARTRAGLSQRRLAELSGVSRRMVQAIEAGERRPRRSLLSAVAAAIARRDRPMNRHDPSIAAHADELTAALVAAAGTSLAPETEHSARRRDRRTADARRAEQRRARPRPPIVPGSRLSTRRQRRLTARQLLEALNASGA